MGLYGVWMTIIFLCRIYILVAFPIQFGFFQGYTSLFLKVDQCICTLLITNVMAQLVFDYPLEAGPRVNKFLVHTFIDAFASIPWYLVGQVFEEKNWAAEELMLYLIWVQLYHIYKVATILTRMEEHFGIVSLLWKIVKLSALEIYLAHAIGCVLYYLALIQENPANTWLGSLKKGGVSYADYKNMPFWPLYSVSSYFAAITISTIGYGDITPMTDMEMHMIRYLIPINTAIMLYVSGLAEAVLSNIANARQDARSQDRVQDQHQDVEE